MRNFNPYEAVVTALKDSKKLIVSGDEGDERIARRDPFDPSRSRNLEARSAYVKGFGDEKPSTQFDIEAYFARFDVVESVRLRRTPHGAFKGSVFVEFQTPEQVAAFLAMDPKPRWGTIELETRSKLDYVDEKNKLINEGKLVPTGQRGSFWGPYDKESQNGGGRGGRGRGRGGRGDRGESPTAFLRYHQNAWLTCNSGDRGRGRGRGDRGRGDRGRRNGGDSNDWKSRKNEERNRGGRDRRDRNDRNEESVKDEKPASTEAPEPNTKRAREDDGAADGQPAAKKADTKTEAPVKAEE